MGLLKWAILLSMLLLGQPTFSAAAEAGADVSSEQLERAMNYFQAGRYEDSLTQLQHASALNPMPRLHYNMSQCHQQLGQKPEELRHLELFLAADPDVQKDAALKQEVSARIAKLRHELNLDKKVSAAPERPLYKRWWVWTLVGGIAATSAASITIGVMAGQNTAPPNGTPLTLNWTNPNVQAAALQLRL